MALDDAQVTAYIRMLTDMTEKMGHVYLSTSCLHRDHSYCQSNTGSNGTKVPGECKFCQAKCICPCHKD